MEIKRVSVVIRKVWELGIKEYIVEYLLKKYSLDYVYFWYLNYCLRKLKCEKFFILINNLSWKGYIILDIS